MISGFFARGRKAHRGVLTGRVLGDHPAGPSKMFAIFLHFTIKWQLVLLGRGPIILPLQLDFLEISGYIINKNIY